MASYDRIGQQYNLNRKPDDRIVKQLIQLLALPKQSIICDIGAGTGNYTAQLANSGFQIDAFEPSLQMIEQAIPHKNIQWHQIPAEEINIQQKYDGAISTLAIHHFSDLDQSLKNIKKALKKDANFIIFCADPRKIDQNCWFKSYFNDLIEKAKAHYLPMEILLEKLLVNFGNQPIVESFSIPYDIQDGFFYAGWQQPEKYLNEAFRRSISVFAKAPKAMVKQSIQHLKEDLESGIWDAQFNNVRTMDSYNGGYFFIKIKN